MGQMSLVTALGSICHCISVVLVVVMISAARGPSGGTTTVMGTLHYNVLTIFCLLAMTPAPGQMGLRESDALGTGCGA